MMEFSSFSQAGQDKFAFESLGRPESGTFLDIGCGHPTSYNNTYGLERMRWYGLLVDQHPEDCGYSNRISRFIKDNACTMDWGSILGSHRQIDYISLDIDESGGKALENLIRHNVTFRCATIEHDCYRIGISMRDEMRKCLLGLGYVLVCGDVLWQPGHPFEDWWVDPHSCNVRDYSGMISMGLMPEKIFEQLCFAQS